jgi:hypothetical protein
MPLFTYPVNDYFSAIFQIANGTRILNNGKVVIVGFVIVKRFKILFRLARGRENDNGIFSIRWWRGRNVASVRWRSIQTIVRQWLVGVRKEPCSHDSIQDNGRLLKTVLKTQK